MCIHDLFKIFQTVIIVGITDWFGRTFPGYSHANLLQRNTFTFGILALKW